MQVGNAAGRFAPGAGPDPATFRPVVFNGQPVFSDNGRDIPGYKVFVGDLPTFTACEDILGWIYRDPSLGQSWALRSELHVNVAANAQTRSARAICTVNSPDAATQLYTAALGVVGHLPV